MLFNFSGGSQESRLYGCIQWSQRHWHANLKRAELLNHVPVHNLKDLLLSPSKMLWPMVLHCQFPKRYQHHTESRITWNSCGEWSLTMGWAALCGCVPLFMATGGARWCVQTGHLTFHGTDKSHLSPIWLLSQLYCSGATQEKLPKWTYLTLLQMLFHIMPLLSSLSWTWCSSGFKVLSFFLWGTLSWVFSTVPGGFYWDRTDLMVLRSSPLPLQRALLHPPLLRFSSPPTCTHTCKHTTSPVPAKIKTEEKLKLDWVAWCHQDKGIRTWLVFQLSRILFGTISRTYPFPLCFSI